MQLGQQIRRGAELGLTSEPGAGVALTLAYRYSDFDVEEVHDDHGDAVFHLDHINALISELRIAANRPDPCTYIHARIAELEKEIR